MMCSIEELGSNREMFPDAPENGLYIFDEDAPVGENAVAYLGSMTALSNMKLHPTV